MIIHNHDQRSPEWYQCRLGIPTASEFKNIIQQKALLKSEILEKVSGLDDEKVLKKMTVADLTNLANDNGLDISPNWVTSENSYHFALAAQIMAGTDPDPFTGNNDTERGNDWEDYAVSRYEKAFDVKTEKVGFITNDEKTAGCSPDRLVGDDGLLEAKSPRAANLIKMWCEDMQHGFCPKDHYVQIQGQLWITERKWCDLFVSHSLIGDKHIRVYPDQTVFDALEEAVLDVSERRDKAISEMMDF